MSKQDYYLSRIIVSHDYSFNALIMAAMRKADTSNLERLKEKFPLIWSELVERYNLPGGLYPNERLEENARVASALEAAKNTET